MVTDAGSESEKDSFAPPLRAFSDSLVIAGATVSARDRPCGAGVLSVAEAVAVGVGVGVGVAGSGVGEVETVATGVSVEVGVGVTGEPVTVTDPVMAGCAWQTNLYVPGCEKKYVSWPLDLNSVVTLVQFGSSAGPSVPWRLCEAVEPSK